jgi:hypothetical protein
MIAASEIGEKVSKSDEAKEIYALLRQKIIRSLTEEKKK